MHESMSGILSGYLSSGGYRFFTEKWYSMHKVDDKKNDFREVVELVVIIAFFAAYVVAIFFNLNNIIGSGPTSLFSFMASLAFTVINLVIIITSFVFSYSNFLRFLFVFWICVLVSFILFLINNNGLDLGLGMVLAIPFAIPIAGTIFLNELSGNDATNLLVPICVILLIIYGYYRKVITKKGSYDY